MADNLRVKICAIGEPGLNIAKEIVENRLISELERLSVFSDRTDNDETTSDIDCHLLGSAIPAFLGRPSVESQIKNYTEEKSLITNKISNCDLLIIVGSCGGNTSTAIYAAIAQIANELKITMVALVIQPFAFEGRRRQQKYTEGLELVKKLSTLTMVCSLEKIVGNKLGKLVLLEAFSYADKKIAHWVTTLFYALTKTKSPLNDREKLVKACQSALSEDEVADSVKMDFV